MKLKSILFPALAAMFLVGCEANGVDPSNFPGGGNNAPPGSVGDLTNCEAPVAGICVLGGDSHAGGLVEALLEGPLAPIGDAIDIEALEDALTALLSNDDGELASVLQGLLVGDEDGSGLQQGLTLLLLGEGEDGTGALADTLQNLLLPNESGNGLAALIGGGEDGEEGVGAVPLLQALLIDGANDENCQSNLGSLCLIAGENSPSQGLVDLLLTSQGLAGGLSQTLTGEALDDLVVNLGDLLEGDGSLGDLVQGLFQDGQLVEGLQLLLQGDPEQGVPSGLVELLDGVLAGEDGVNLGDILGDVLGGLLGGLPFP